MCLYGHLASQEKGVCSMKKEYKKPTMQRDDLYPATEELEEMGEQNNKYHTNPEFVCRKVGEEFILIPIGKMAEEFNGLASLNDTGVFLWNLLSEGKHSLRFLISRFAQEYDLSAGQSTTDVLEFMEAACAKKLVLIC